MNTMWIWSQVTLTALAGDAMGASAPSMVLWQACCCSSPPGSSPVWSPEEVTGDWLDCCGFIKPPGTKSKAGPPSACQSWTKPATASRGSIWYVPKHHSATDNRAVERCRCNAPNVLIRVADMRRGLSDELHHQTFHHEDHCKTFIFHTNRFFVSHLCQLSDVKVRAWALFAQ